MSDFSNIFPSRNKAPREQPRQHSLLADPPGQRRKPSPEKPAYPFRYCNSAPEVGYLVVVVM